MQNGEGAVIDDAVSEIAELLAKASSGSVGIWRPVHGRSDSRRINRSKVPLE